MFKRKKTRKFTDVVKKIKKVAPQCLIDELEKGFDFSAPEIIWEKLSQSVSKHVSPSSTDETAIAVYSILCNCSKSEMKARFEADGL